MVHHYENIPKLRGDSHNRIQTKGMFNFYLNDRIKIVHW